MITFIDLHPVTRLVADAVAPRWAGVLDRCEFVGGAGVHAMLQWHDAWRDIASDAGLSTLDAARLFAMLSTASSDGLIGCWDSKYNYAFWRPVTAIRVGGGNPNLEADPDWIGFVITPNHPEYPAAHGCFSGAVVATLQAYFGTDEFSFRMTSPAPGLIRPVRQYDSFSQALEDALLARIYGGCITGTQLSTARSSASRSRGRWSRTFSYLQVHGRQIASRPHSERREV